MTKLNTDVENKFEYLFMALDPCISGFKVCCKLVIVMDGTDLKGKYKSIMFITTTIDGNEKLFPLTYGFGDRETDRS